MPFNTLQAESADENPEIIWTNACETFAMAKADLEQAGDSDAELSLYGPAQFEAITAMMLTPATGLDALAHKLATFIEQDCCGLVPECRDKMLETMLDDVQRIEGDSK